MDVTLQRYAKNSLPQILTPFYWAVVTDKYVIYRGPNRIFGRADRLIAQFA